MVDSGTPLVSDSDFCDMFFSNRRNRQFPDSRLRMSSVDMGSKIYMISNHHVSCYIRYSALITNIIVIANILFLFYPCKFFRCFQREHGACCHAWLGKNRRDGVSKDAGWWRRILTKTHPRKCSRERLQEYLDEYHFCFSRRACKDTIFDVLIRRMVSYEPKHLKQEVLQVRSKRLTQLGIYGQQFILRPILLYRIL